MQPLKEQFWITLGAIGKLLWIVVVRICLLVLSMLRYVYRHRVEIMQHKITLPMLIVLSVMWSGYKGKQYFSELSQQTATPEVVTGRKVFPEKKAQRTVAIVSDSEIHPQLMKAVEGWLGTPQRDGQSNKQGTDCSGFVREVYKEIHHIELSASSAEMFQKDIKSIDKDELQPGDLVFFNTFGRGVSHVGIYLADGKFAHTSTSKGVTIDNLDSPYYMRKYYGSGRVISNN